MGGRTSTMLIAVAGIAAVAVMAWSLAASLSLAEGAPYLLGSIGVVTALVAAVLILKDLILLPFKALNSPFTRVRGLVPRWPGPMKRSPARNRVDQAPVVRKRH
jgi:hypothetical protein